MITSWIRLFEMNNDQIFEYLTQDEILKVMSINLSFRDLSICQIRVERRKLLELFRNADRWKDLLHRMKDPSKQLIVNQSKRVIQVINKHLTVTSKSEFLKCLKEFPVYSIIPPTLHFPSLYSLTIEYELFFFICELNQKNHYNFTIQSLKLFTFASPSHKMRKAVASWIEPYLPLATKKLFIQGWPYNKMNTENNQFFPNLSSTLEVLSFHHCGSLKLHENSLPNLQTLVLRHTIITNLKDLASLKVLELSHQFHMNAKNIPKVKKLILKKCYYISHLKTLQGIEEVEIINCKITNYMNVLKDVKRLSIDITQHHSGMYSDSEQEDNDDDVNEEGSLYEGQFLHDSDCEDEEEESNESDDDKHDEDEDEDEQHNEEEEEDDDEAGDTQGALNFDLSQYSQLQRVKVLSRSFSVEGPLISKDLPKTLKTLTFLSYTTAIDPFILYFSNLHMVEIGHCHQINSLYGLGNVRRLKLIYLNALTSLDGLGGNYNGSKSDEIYQNEFVQITLCDHITDFSPLKHVKEIDINDCVGFRNGFDVDHVHTLTISSCKNIVDVSMLHQLQRLKFLKCDGILSLKGLEDVPNLSFESCRHLQLQHHKEPVFKKDYGIRIMSDALTSLPDSLYPQMLTYLGNQDRLSMIHCNCYLYQRLIRKYRIFQLKNYRIVELFFTDSLFRDKLFDRMEDSSKQLILQEPIMLVNFSDPTIFCINGWNKLSLSVSSFLSLLQAFPNAFPNVSILHLMNYSHCSDYDSAAAISSLNTTVTVKDRLTLEGIKIRSSIKLPETLKHLMLDDCSLSIENLQTILFTLKTLTIQHHTKLTNIELFNFNNLHTLILKNKELINLKLFNKVKQLFLYDCHRLQNLDSLQDNEKIVIDFSTKTVIVEQDNDDNNIENGNDIDYNYNLSRIRNPKLMNLFFHFSHSKSIELTFTDHKVAIDLSYYDNIEKFTLAGSLHTFSQQRSIPSFYTKNIPTPLKVLKLHGVMNLETLGECNFDHLQYIELVRCGLTSLVGLGNVKFVRLEDLPDLSSLEGLGNRNRKVILKDLMSLDFEPVKNVYDLTLIGCTHFTSMPMVYGIKRLRFEGCSNFEYLRCEDLEQLEVCRCNKLKTIQGMGRVAKLIIKDCVCLDDYPEGKKWN